MVQGLVQHAQVRIPVGYWLFAETADDAPPFVPGAYKALDNAFKLAAQYGMGVLVDMHAAPASQNGCARKGSRTHVCIQCSPCTLYSTRRAVLEVCTQVSIFSLRR